MRFLLSLLIPPAQRPLWQRALVVLLAVAVAVGGRALLSPWLGGRSPFALLIPAIAVSAWFGGVPAGLLTTLLGAVAANWLFIPPVGDVALATSADVVTTLLFILQGLMVCGMLGVLHYAVAALREERQRSEQTLIDARETLRTQAASLEKEVEARTASLRDSNAELEAFSYSVSHDLRTPLRFVRGFTEAITEDTGNQLTSESRDYLQRILNAADRMDTLIKDLLAYSRIGRAEVQIVDQPLDAVVADVATLHQQSLQQAQAQLIVESPLPVVRADKTGLAQALSNLVGNAIKFAKPGVPGVVRIRAESAGNRVRLWVEDNGIGIDPQHHDRVFKLFERLHPAAEFPGSGIGLSLVRKAVTRMGGACGVESTPGEGARFWIEIPRA